MAVDALPRNGLYVEVSMGNVNPARMNMDCIFLLGIYSSSSLVIAGVVRVDVVVVVVVVVEVEMRLAGRVLYSQSPGQSSRPLPILPAFSGGVLRGPACYYPAVSFFRCFYCIVSAVRTQSRVWYIHVTHITWFIFDQSRFVASSAISSNQRQCATR